MTHPDNLLDDYFRCFETKDWKAYGWAVTYLDDLVRSDPDEALTLTLTLIDASNSDAYLAYIAAGPLEVLLQKHGPAVIARVDEESRKNAKVRLALSGVWGIYRGHPVFERWYALMVKYGFTGGRKAPL
jgi:Family of unknown function (DUF6869)